MAKSPRTPPPPAPRRRLPAAGTPQVPAPIPVVARAPAGPAIPTVPPAAFSAFAKSTSEGARAMSRILLIDLAEREMQARTRLKNRIDELQTQSRRVSGQSAQLDVILKEVKRITREKPGITPEQLGQELQRELPETARGALSIDQTARLAELLARLNSDNPVDDFYKAVAAEVARKTWKELSAGSDPEYVLKYGLFGSQRTSMTADLGVNEREIAMVCGLLQLDNLADPAHDKFTTRIAERQGEYRQHLALFDAAYERAKQRSEVTLQSQIDNGTVSKSVIGCIEPDHSIDDRVDETRKQVPGADELVRAISARTVAQVVRRLATEKITPNDPWLASRIDTAFSRLTGAIDGAPPSSIEIDLPDLEVESGVDIDPENLQAVQAIYFTYQLEEMRMFQVVERIVDLFRQGMLPLGRGYVSDFLYHYYQKAGERMTEGERRDLYFRCFGAPGGNPNMGEPNRDFNELWLRFLSAVSSFSRQLSVDRMLRSNVPVAVSQEQVRKAGRDLAANLSRNGYGIAYNAAIEMQQSILDFKTVLTNPDLRNVFGARDMWQVIDLVNANYLGGARNTHRFRTQSRNGAIIIRWLANHVQALTNIAGPVLLIDQIVDPQMFRVESNHKPTIDPTDWDLVNACEQWLAVGGVQGQSVEQYAQPIEAPITSARPIGMPQFARDALDSAGISLPA